MKKDLQIPGSAIPRNPVFLAGTKATGQPTIIVTDSRGRVVSVSAEFEAAEGYSRSRVIGKNVAELKNSTHDGHLYQTICAAISRSEDGIESGGVTEAVSDGRKVQVIPLCDHLGTISNYTAICHAVDSALRRQEAAEKSLDKKRMTRFANEISQRFNYLHAVIADRANLLLAKHGENNRYRREIEEILKSTDKAASIVRKLLAFAKLQILALEREKVLSSVDPLTGTVNARAFRDRAREEIDRSRRYGRPFTLAYVDLDNFKAVNDRFGHSAGDNLLRLVTDIIRKNLRTTDIFARVGGDEFAFLLPETDQVSAHAVLDKIRNKVASSLQEAGLPVTMSVGAMVYLSPPDSVDSMIRQADNLMYQAKYSGKNRIRQEVYGG
jgi:diguanylate cyclase (GGDEF)-like protein/PAS domain S-box-containing protein